MSILDKIQLHNAVKQAGQGKVNVHQKPKPVGDGISDSIQGLIDGEAPVNVSSGEFVMPADVVSALGEGDTNAGSQVLADLIESIRNADMKQLKERQKNPPKNVDTKESDEDSNFFLGGLFKGGQKEIRANPDPDWLVDIKRKNIERANEAAGEEFTPYATEDRIAGFTPDELQAQQMVRDRIGSEQDLLDISSQGISDVLSRSLGDPQTEVQPYLNPYVEGALETTVADLDDRFDSKRQEIRSQAGGAGAFGGSRQAILEGRAEEGRDRAVGDVLSRGRMDAYDRAFGQRGSDLSRAGGAAGQAGSIARTSQQVGLGDIASLSGSGQDQRFLDQTGRDFDYQQFVEERDWDLTRPGQLATIIQGTGFRPDLQDVQETASPFSKALGIGQQIGGMFAGKPPDPNAFTFRRDGGVIPETSSYQNGGQVAQQKGNSLSEVLRTLASIPKSNEDHRVGVTPLEGSDGGTNRGGSGDMGFLKTMLGMTSGGGGAPAANPALHGPAFQDGGQLKKPNSVLESILSNIGRPVMEANQKVGQGIVDAGSSIMDILNNVKMNEQETKELLGTPSEQPPEMWAGVPQEVGEVPDAVKTVLNPNAQDNAPEYGVDPALKESKKTTQDTLPSVKEEVAKKAPEVIQKVMENEDEQRRGIGETLMDALNPQTWDMDRMAFGARLASTPGDFIEGFSKSVLAEQGARGQQAKDEAAIESTEAQAERARAQIEKWLKEPEAAKLDIVSKMANRAAMAANKKAEAAAAMMEDPGDWSTNFQVYLRDMMAPFPDEIKKDVLSRLGEVNQDDFGGDTDNPQVIVREGPPPNN